MEYVMTIQIAAGMINSSEKKGIVFRSQLGLRSTCQVLSDFCLGWGVGGYILAYIHSLYPANRKRQTLNSEFRSLLEKNVMCIVKLFLLRKIYQFIGKKKTK